MQNGLFDLPSGREILVGVALVTLGFVLRSSLVPAHSLRTIPSPRKTLLPTLEPAQIKDLPYPPDALPGGRDVDSPYGSTRVYEFGPEDGRKVLLIHGISTPCLALGGLAHALVKKGCRVMLFDLFGRGYSDDPDGVEHDIRLFSTQILIVLTSSSSPWKEFDVVGYSLGGGIATAFTSYFGHLVRSLILIAPSGLIREKHISRTSRVLYRENVLLEPLLLRLVKRRLRKPVPKPEDGKKTDATQAVGAEINLENNQQIVLSQSHPDITIDKAVNFQVDRHQGFVRAFMSSIRHGPIWRQHEWWKVVGETMTERGEAVLIVLGERDGVIQCDELQEDASQCLDGHVRFVVLDAGHEVPISKGNEVANQIWSFWQDMKPSKPASPIS